MNQFLDLEQLKRFAEGLNVLIKEAEQRLDEKIVKKSDQVNTYTKQEVDQALSGKASNESLESEKSRRENSDTQLQRNIEKISNDSQTALALEKKERQSAEQKLQNDIYTEENERKESYRELNNTLVGAINLVDKKKPDKTTVFTKDEVNVALAKKATTESVIQIQSIIERLNTLLGYSATRKVVNLMMGESGKYVKCESRSAVANAAFAISKPFDVDACSELLIKTGFNPSDASHKGLDLSVIAIYEQIERQRTVQKKNSDGQLLYYVVTTDAETGNQTVTQDETTENTGYPVYTVETYTETRYLPNNEDRFVAIPDSGYYVANIPQSCKVVVSYKPGISDTAVIIEKHGAIANLISQVFGIYEHRTMVECMVSLEERIKAIEQSRGLLGNATAGTLDVSEITKCRYPMTLFGHGVPAEANKPTNLPEGLPWDGCPMFKGQMYINLDAASGGLYYAVSVDSVNGWKQA